MPSWDGASPRYILHLLSFAFRIIHPRTDNDDDRETAAGGRLAHLLQILVSNCPESTTRGCSEVLQEVNNVLVVVSRYFGGLHIGPDRFKHINQSARNALELGGFLEGVADSHKKQRGRK